MSETVNVTEAPAVSTTSSTGTVLLRPPLKLLVPTLVLIIYWVVTEASYRLEMGMFYRFITRMIVLLLFLLFFLAWGFSRRHFTFGQRLSAFIMMIGTMFVAGAVGHPATGTAATAMMGLPIVITLSIAWLWLTRRSRFTVELAGIGLACVAVFGTISLLRWDGMDGRQRALLTWRWTPNPEERFLQQASQPPAVVAAQATADQPVLEESAEDWSSFRGGNREGEVRGVRFSDWNQSPPKEVWRRRVGPGWSSIIAIGDYLFTQEQRDKREAVVCYDAATGHEVWVHSSDGSADRFEDSLSGTGPRATPTFHEGRIYAYGAKGSLDCMDAMTGKSHWAKSLFAITGAAVPQWGSATSPAVIDDKVLVFVGGKQGNSLLALDRKTGDQLWQAAGGTTSYSTPQVMTIADRRQIVMHDDAGLRGLQLEDGKVLWDHPSPNAGSFQPMLQPHLLANDRLLVNWDSGLLCLKISSTDDKWQTESQWTSNRLKPSFNEFAIHKGYIYGLDDGILACADLEKGQRIWKRGRYGFGQMLLLPEIDELLVLSEQGEVIRVAADPTELRELGRFKAIEGKTWNHPMLAHGRLIVRNSEEMACFAVTLPTVTANLD
ncbi:MAG: outer membrane protein assembly factor BamB [Schlesneria sp.]|nr:outer membrane protein assembly factor BamB [Schlesneria sp.]